MKLFGIEYALGRGLDWVNLGGCLPSPRDGSLANKRAWGGELRDRRDSHHDLLVRWPRFTPRVGRLSGRHARVRPRAGGVRRARGGSHRRAAPGVATVAAVADAWPGAASRRGLGWMARLAAGRDAPATWQAPAVRRGRRRGRPRVIQGTRYLMDEAGWRLSDRGSGQSLCWTRPRLAPNTIGDERGLSRRAALPGGTKCTRSAASWSFRLPLTAHAPRAWSAARRPATDNHVPVIAGLEAGELEFRNWRAEVIAAGFEEGQELGGHQRAEGVRTAILSSPVAALRAFSRITTSAALLSAVARDTAAHRRSARLP